MCTPVHTRPADKRFLGNNNPSRMEVHDLENEEKEEMKNRLNFIVKETKTPHFKSLANELGQFVESDALQTTEDTLNLFDKIIARWKMFEDNYLTENRVMFMSNCRHHQVKRRNHYEDA